MPPQFHFFADVRHGSPLTKVARGVKGDWRYPEYPAVGVDDDVGVLVVLVRDRVERPDVALPHSLRCDVNALHAAVLRLLPFQSIVVPPLGNE